MSLNNAEVPVLGFVAPSGTGKTTLLVQVVGLLNAAGLRVGVIKQARDDFDVDQPGKDSFELRKAGVERLLLASERQAALVIEKPEPRDPELDELLCLLDQDTLDLVLVEGYREMDFPKIELVRQGGRPPRYPNDPWVIAVASDTPLTTHVSQLDINQPGVVAEFVRRWLADKISATCSVPQAQQVK